MSVQRNVGGAVAAAGRFVRDRPGLGYGLCSALLLYGVAVMDRSGRSFLPEWAVRLGTASYSIYLVHIIALILTQQALRRLRLVMDLPLEIA